MASSRSPEDYAQQLQVQQQQQHPYYQPAQHHQQQLHLQQQLQQQHRPILPRPATSNEGEQTDGRSGTVAKRQQVLVACAACQKRKSKCTGMSSMSLNSDCQTMLTFFTFQVNDHDAVCASSRIPNAFTTLEQARHEGHISSVKSPNSLKKFNIFATSSTHSELHLPMKHKAFCNAYSQHQNWKKLANSSAIARCYFPSASGQWKITISMFKSNRLRHHPHLQTEKGRDPALI